MISMTGFGRAKSKTEKAIKTSKKAEHLPEIDVSVRTVNGRFLEIRLHLPREYSEFESALREKISAKFSRGTVDVFVNRRAKSRLEGADVIVNKSLAQKWLKAYGQLAQELKLKSEPTIDLISKIPDVIQVEQTLHVSDGEKKALLRLVDEALDCCYIERQREGGALSVQIRKHLQELEQKASVFEATRELANRELHKRFEERLKKLGTDLDIDPQRLAQEILIQIDRADISEEITRLREHLKAYLQLLKSSGSEGRKLDFYAQELLREVNTIGSKSQVSKLTAAVVDAKSLIEKIREQVQNIE